MKRYLLFPMFFLLSFSAHAGQYDGAWVSPTLPNEYFVVRSVGNTIAVIRLGDIYEIFLGPLNNGSAQVETFTGPVNFKANINFINEQEATLEVTDCSPLDQCDFSPSTILSFDKFF